MVSLRPRSRCDARALVARRDWRLEASSEARVGSGDAHSTHGRDTGVHAVDARIVSERTVGAAKRAGGSQLCARLGTDYERNTTSVLVAHYEL